MATKICTVCKEEFEPGKTGAGDYCRMHYRRYLRKSPNLHQPGKVNGRGLSETVTFQASPDDVAWIANAALENGYPSAAAWIRAQLKLPSTGLR